MALGCRGARREPRWQVPKGWGAGGTCRAGPFPAPTPFLCSCWGQGWGHHAPSVLTAGARPWSHRLSGSPCSHCAGAMLAPCPPRWHRRGSDLAPNFATWGGPCGTATASRAGDSTGDTGLSPNPRGAERHRATAGRGCEGAGCGRRGCPGAVLQLRFPPLLRELRRALAAPRRPRRWAGAGLTQGPLLPRQPRHGAFAPTFFLGEQPRRGASRSSGPSEGLTGNSGTGSPRGGGAAGDGGAFGTAPGELWARPGGEEAPKPQTNVDVSKSNALGWP